MEKEVLLRFVYNAAELCRFPVKHSENVCTGFLLVLDLGSDIYHRKLTRLGRNGEATSFATFKTKV